MSSFPENIKDREDFILDQVMLGNFEAKWVEVSYMIDGKNLKLNVMEDALKINGIRVNVSAALEQTLADVFDASLMTPQVADIVFISAKRRTIPSPMQISSSVNSMIKHSKNVDSQIDLNVHGLISTVGKHWVLDKQLETKQDVACNYGWHFVGDTFQGIKGFPAASKVDFNGIKIKVIQPNATAHNANHTDYSQICQLVSQTCWVDDKEYRFSDLLCHDSLHTLVSHQGKINVQRQPNVAKKSGVRVLFPVIV